MSLYNTNTDRLDLVYIAMEDEEEEEGESIGKFVQNPLQSERSSILPMTMSWLSHWLKPLYCFSSLAARVFIMNSRRQD